MTIDTSTDLLMKFLDIFRMAMFALAAGMLGVFYASFRRKP